MHALASIIYTQERASAETPVLSVCTRLLSRMLSCRFCLPWFSLVLNSTCSLREPTRLSWKLSHGRKIKAVVRLTSFVFHRSGISVLLYVMSSLLKNVYFMYLSIFYCCCFRKKVNLVPVHSSWPKVDVSATVSGNVLFFNFQLFTANVYKHNGFL